MNRDGNWRGGGGDDWRERERARGGEDDHREAYPPDWSPSTDYTMSPAHEREVRGHEFGGAWRERRRFGGGRFAREPGHVREYGGAWSERERWGGRPGYDRDEDRDFGAGYGGRGGSWSERTEQELGGRNLSDSIGPGSFGGSGRGADERRGADPGPYGQYQYGRGYERPGFGGRGAEYEFGGAFREPGWHGEPGFGEARGEPWRGGAARGAAGPKGYVRSDERIREDVCDRLMSTRWIDTSDVEVRVVDGEVTLTGTVQHREDKRRIEDIAESILGVKDVANAVKVRRIEEAARDVGLGAAPTPTTPAGGTLGGDLGTNLRGGPLGTPTGGPGREKPKA